MQGPEEGRLAATVRSEHADRYARFGGEADPAQHDLGPIARREALGPDRGAAHAEARVAVESRAYTSAPITATGGPGGRSSQYAV